MCTRYYIEKDAPELEEIVRGVEKSLLADRFHHKMSGPILTEGEIGPMSIAPVLASNKNGKRTTFPMKWGFEVGAKLHGQEKSNVVFNARTETVSQKPSFADFWRSRRCIVPASWYYEWEHFTDSSGNPKTGTRYSFQPRGQTVVWLCGLYKMVEDLPYFVILTRAPTTELAKIHDRMPLILPESRIDDWINPEKDPRKLLKDAVTDLVYWK